MLSSKDRSRALRERVKRDLFPLIEALGFRRLKHTGRFYGFGRVRDGRFQLLEIQWDKYHRPRFLVNFGSAEVERNDGKEGLRNPFTNEWLALDEAGAGSLLTYYRLYRGRSPWFRHGLMSGLLGSDGARAATRRCAAMLPLVEGWFEDDAESIVAVNRMNRRSG